jgi:endoglucanase
MTRVQLRPAVLLFAVTAGALLSVAARPCDAQARVNPFRGRRMWIDPSSAANKQASDWQRSRPTDAALMHTMGEQPQAIWLGDWNRDVRSDVDQRFAAARGDLLVFVVYNIPYRDCGSYSRGGSGGADDYRRWIIELARGIRSRPSVIILEPDAVAGGDCLPIRLRDERDVLLRETVDVLRKSGATVYLDAGHAGWHPAADMAARLQRAGIDLADGFALNVSNFQPTGATIAYGDALSRLVGGLHYVIDTSRNGLGVADQSNWCNPPGMALGGFPTSDTQSPLVDAFLWIKTPGQSDGTCNGGPRAGEWWPDYALGLSRAAATIRSTGSR